MKRSINRIMKKNSRRIVLDMSSNQIRCAVGRFDDVNFTVENIFSIPIERGVYENGVILDNEKLRHNIRKHLDLYNVRAKNCVVITESTEILKRDITIPKVDDNDLDDLVRYEVVQYLPIDLNDYILQHHRVADVDDDDIAKIIETIVAMPKTIAKSHFDLISSVGLKPVALDLKGHSMMRLANCCDNYSKETSYAYVDIDFEKIEINIACNGKIMLNRILTYGIGDVDKIMQDHGIESENQKKHLYNLLMSYGVDDLIQGFVNSELANGEVVYNDLRDFFRQTVAEIERILKFYLSRNIYNSIDQVIVYGSVARVNQIDKFIEKQLNIPTTKYLPVGNRFSQVEIEDKDYPLFINALGGLVKI